MKWIIKDAGVAGDNDPPASPAINGPGFSWHKLPQQKQTNQTRKSPKLVTGAFAVKPNAIYPNAGITKYAQSQERDDHGRFTSGGSVKDMFSRSLGINRVDMPQVPNGPMKDRFVAELKSEGVSVKLETVQANSLKPTQGDYNEENIAFLRKEHGKGAFKDSNRIVVSQDDRVLDGHHRWVVLAQEGKSINVIRVGLPIKELLAHARKFNVDNDIQSRTKHMTDFKKSEDLDAFESIETIKAEQSRDPKTGEFVSEGGEKTDLYKRRNDARVDGDKAMAALKEALRNKTKKGDASDGSEPAEYNSADGRPRWMQSPGQGGRDPVYRSQKPGPAGNGDALFSKNVNENAPKVAPVDQDSYYIW